MLTILQYPERRRAGAWRAKPRCRPHVRAARPLAGARGSDCAFTLLEVLIVVALVAVALGIVSLAFRKIGDSNRLSVAVGTLTQCAAVARAYALEHALETMIVVNNANGRIELWHKNPPPGGGPWDPLSQNFPNGFVYAPIFDSSVSLPIGSDGRPMVVVHPLDFDVPAPDPNVPGALIPLRDTAPSQENWDNLMWPAVAFDAEGRLIRVMRRFATRLQTDYQGNPVANFNRRADGTPNIGSPLPLLYEVDANDSRVTTAPGFIVSDRGKYEEQLTTLFPTPADIVNVWLARAKLFPEFVRFVVISPWSGRELATVQ